MIRLSGQFRLLSLYLLLRQFGSADGQRQAMDAKNSSRRFTEARDAMSRASKPIIAQASAWIAIVMLLVQSLPVVSCGCGNGDAVDGHKVAQTANSCCSSTKPVSCCTKNAKSTCCSRDTRSSCCNRDHSAVRATSTCCGQNCTCTMSRATGQDPVIPVPQKDNRQERLELVTWSALASISLVSACPTTLRLRHPGQFIRTTALDRCIELSRFTC